MCTKVIILKLAFVTYSLDLCRAPGGAASATSASASLASKKPRTAILSAATFAAAEAETAPGGARVLVVEGGTPPSPFKLLPLESASLL